MVGECVSQSYGGRHHHTTFLALFSRQLPVCWFGVRVRLWPMWAWGSSPAVADVGSGFESCGGVFEFGWCDLPCAGVGCCTEAPWMLLIPLRAQTLIYTDLVCVKFTMGIEPS